MPTLGTTELSEAVEAIRAASELALRNRSAEEFEQVERQISLLDGAVREVQQSLWAAEAKTAIRNLEGNRPLTDADLKAIRVFLISDAERYLAHENNYNDWLQELRRLMNEIAHRARAVDRDSIADLRGVIKDAIRLVPDIRNYLDEQHRVEMFSQSLRALDDPTRTTLARLLKEQLHSPNL